MKRFIDGRPRDAMPPRIRCRRSESESDMRAEPGHPWGLVVGLVIAAFAIGCPQPPAPATVEWHAVGACEGCDAALRRAVDHMQVTDVESATRSGIPDAAAVVAAINRDHPEDDASKAIPERVCKQPDKWIVVFKTLRKDCVGVEVKADGSVWDIHLDLVCDRWERKPECFKVTWTEKPK
jgi:hypothetical protein